MEQSAPLRLEPDGAVATITLNRPESRNAINREMSDRLLVALEELDSDPEIQAVVLTGAGTGFSSGMDLAEYTACGVPASLHEILGRTSAKPLIAAVEGFAVAGGLELALTCDLIVSSREALFGLPEAKVGLVAWYAAGRIQRLVPRQIAAELLFTGAMQSASSLAGQGLINRLVEPGEALSAATGLARQIAGNAPLSLRASKRLLDCAHGLGEAQYAGKAREIAGTVYASHDSTEGAQAFMDKRPPMWRGE